RAGETPAVPGKMQRSGIRGCGYAPMSTNTGDAQKAMDPTRERRRPRRLLPFVVARNGHCETEARAGETPAVPGKVQRSGIRGCGSAPMSTNTGDTQKAMDPTRDRRRPRRLLPCFLARNGHCETEARAGETPAVPGK